MTVYLNWRGPQGRETVDEFTCDPAQSYREYNRYINSMVNEYRLAGMNVYRSSRPCANWRDG